MTLGKRVEQRRKALRLSQGELAEMAHITQGLLSRIEHDHNQNPGLEAMRGLARALRCSIDYLAGTFDDDLVPASREAVSA